MKILECAYLYQDGHSVEVWRQIVKQNPVHWVIVRERYVSSGPLGRIIIPGHQSALYKALKGADVEAVVPDVTHGSTHTQSGGIAVGYIRWRTAQGDHALITTIEGLSGPYTYQPESEERFEDVKECREWSGYPIDKIVSATR